MNIAHLFTAQKRHSLYWRTAPIEERREGLIKLAQKIRTHQREICDAMFADFGKPEMEVLTTEIFPTLQEIHHALKSLKRWAKPRKVPATLFLTGTRSAIHYEPKGVVLVIAPWNFPFNLALIPVVSALAAGNCVILKPSEMTPKTSQLIESFLTDIFPANQVLTLQGGKEISQELLTLPFDHIFFTGSTEVGKVVMSAASKHLSDVTLELGGKSPTVIDETADLNTTARKIVWGKFVNAGQTCIAPDYLLVQSEIYPALLEKLKEHIDDLYRSPEKDLARVISNHHLQRLSQMFNEALSKGAQLVTGGQFDFQKNTLSPTVLEAPSSACQLLNEEIFGPLLPVLKYNHLNEALEYINNQPKPLALYVFSKSAANINAILKTTSAGGVCVNDVLLQFANHHLPFGGVGSSGLGSYHGHHGFLTFSHAKAVLKQSWMGKVLAVLYPPYEPWKLKLAKIFVRWGV